MERHHDARSISRDPDRDAGLGKADRSDGNGDRSNETDHHLQEGTCQRMAKSYRRSQPQGCRSKEEGSNPTIVDSTHKGVRKWTPFPPSLALHALKFFMELFFPRKRARPVAGCEYCFSFVLT